MKSTEQETRQLGTTTEIKRIDTVSLMETFSCFFQLKNFSQVKKCPQYETDFVRYYHTISKFAA